MSTIDRLEVQVQTNAHKANTELDLMSAKLDKVAASLSGVQNNGLNQLSSGVNHLASAMRNMSSVRATDFTRIANGIEKIGRIDSKSIYNASNAIRNISNSINGMSATVPKGVSDIAQLATAISRLGYKSTSNAIDNMPRLAQAMNELITTLAKAPIVNRNVIDITNSISNLASQGNKVSSASKSIQRSLNGTTNSTKQYSDATRSASSYTVSFRAEIMKLYAAMYALKGIATTLYGSIKKSMDYGETVNLFQTVFKKIGSDEAKNLGYEKGSKDAENYAIGFIDKAQEFNDDLTNALSLNPDEMMNYQAIFGQISNAMGNTQQTALNLSESFTILGTDMASLFNDDISTAMNKLQQGLVGQVRGLREYGIDITEATLQTYAYKYGIEDSIDKMSQAAKVQLRYLAIMDQGKISMGDMAKTLNSASNQVRVLKQNWDNLCRSIGNLFLPIIQNVLPYLNGFLIAIRNIIDAFATLTGYSTPDYKDSNINAYSGVANDLLDISGAEDKIGDSADDAKKKVDKLNKSLAKFDELNDIGKNKNDGGTSNKKETGKSGEIGGGGYSSLDDAINKVNEGYMNEFQKQLEATGNKAKEIAEIIQPKLEAIISLFDKLKPAIIGIATAFATYKIINLFKDLGEKLALLGGSTTGIIALVIGGLVAIGTAIYQCWKKAKDNDLSKRFGDITLSAEELETVANRIVDNGTLDNLKTAMSSWKELDTIKDKIDGAVDTLNKYNWKVSIGMKLSEAEEKDYKEAIQTYIDKSQNYIEQQQLAVLMSIDLLVRDEDTKNQMIETSTKFYSSAQGELEKLGKDLNQCVTDAWSDGLLDIDEAKEISEIQGQMASVMEQVAASNFTAKMQMIEMDFSGANLDADSFKKLVDKSQELVDNAIKDYDEVTLNLLASVDAQYKAGTIDTKEYDKQMKAIKEGRLSNIGEITLNATKFNLNTLYKTFQTELDTRLPDFQESLNSNVDKWFDALKEGGVAEGEWGLFFMSIEDEVNSGYKQLGDIAKSNLGDFLKKMEPTEEQLKEQAKQWLAMGESVPKNVSDGLASIEYLKAMTGNTDALYTLIGMTIGNSEEKKEMLKKAKESGVELDEELILGIEASTSDINKTVEELISGIDTNITSQTDGILTNTSDSGEKVGNAYGDGISSSSQYVNDKTNELSNGSVEQFKKLDYTDSAKASGKNVGDNYGDGISSSSDYVNKKSNGLSKGSVEEFKKLDYANSAKSSGTNIGKNYGDGISSKGDYVTSSSSGLAKKATNQFEKSLGIDEKSSSIFERYGKYTVNGYNQGIFNYRDTTTKKMSGWAALSEKGMKDSLGIKGTTSSDYESYGKYTVQGFNKGIQEEGGSEKSKGIIATWADKVKGWFKSKFDIHSPSRVFKQFGGFTVEGYNEGIYDNIDSTKSVITKWSDSINDSASKLTVKPIDFKSNYTVNTSGMEGFSDLTKDSTVTMKAMESIDIDQTSNSLNDLPRAITQAVVQGLRGASFPATITQNEVVNSIRNADEDQFYRTGIGIFEH